MQIRASIACLHSSCLFLKLEHFSGRLTVSSMERRRVLLLPSEAWGRLYHHDRSTIKTLAASRSILWQTRALEWRGNQDAWWAAYSTSYRVRMGANSRSLCFRGARLTYRAPQDAAALTEFDRLFETLHRRTGIGS